MKSPATRFLAALAVVAAMGSCSKVPVNPPIPITVLHSLEKFPFQTWLDSIQGLSSDGIYITVQGKGLFDQLQKHGESPGQCEAALAFRSSTTGAVTSLGVLEPAAGYTHHMTLWDSATGEVLAHADVPSLNAGQWTYVSLALDGLEVPIQPNHGYIVGFNTLAEGDAIGAGTPGDDVTLLYGVYDYRDYPGTAPGFLPILPLTEGSITYEGEWQVYYDTILGSLIYPGTTPAGIIPQTVLGVCDIGFIPAPQ